MSHELTSSKKVTKPNDGVLIYHESLHRDDEITVALYLGLPDRRALRKLRISPPVLFYVDWFRQMFERGMNGNKNINYLTPEDLKDVFRLYSDPASRRGCFKSPHTADGIRQAYLLPNGSLNAGLARLDRIKHFASFLSMIKTDFSKLKISQAHWQTFSAYPDSFEPGFSDAPFALPKIPFSQELIPAIKSYREYGEHPFEAYQRVYVLVRHAAHWLTYDNYKQSIGTSLSKRNLPGNETTEELRGIVDSKYYESQDKRSVQINQKPLWMRLHTPGLKPEPEYHYTAISRYTTISRVTTIPLDKKILRRPRVRLDRDDWGPEIEGLMLDFSLMKYSGIDEFIDGIHVGTFQNLDAKVKRAWLYYGAIAFEGSETCELHSLEHILIYDKTSPEKAVAWHEVQCFTESGPEKQTFVFLFEQNTGNSSQKQGEKRRPSDEDYVVVQPAKMGKYEEAAPEELRGENTSLEDIKDYQRVNAEIQKSDGAPKPTGIQASHRTSYRGEGQVSTASSVKSHPSNKDTGMQVGNDINEGRGPSEWGAPGQAWVWD